MPTSKQASLDEIRMSDRLPSPSGVAMEILRLTRDPDASTAELSQVLATDPALAAQILKYANSAQVRTGQSARSVNEAVVRLGLATVRQLALGFSLLSRARSGPCAAFDYNGFWTESLAAAVCGQTLGHHLRNVVPDEAFTCGLLGQIGRLCLASVHPEQYSQVLQRWRDDPAVPLRRLETEIFSIDHVAIAVALFADWGLPESYRQAVGLQDHTEGIQALPASQQTLPRLLNLARQLAAICVAQPPARPPLVQELLRQASAVDLDEAMLAGGCEQALLEWQHMGQVLDLLVGDVPPIQDLVARARQKATDANEPVPAPDHDAPVAADVVEVLATGLRILVADDNPVDRRLISAMLQNDRAQHQITTAQNGHEALRTALATSPQVIITDWLMPQLTGLELCTLLRKSPETAHTYVIVMTTQLENEKLVEAFEAGADDYLAKPVNRKILGARMLAVQRLVGLREQVEHDREEIRRFAAEQAVLNRKLQQMALHDELTGIGNRRAAMQHLQREWADVERHGQPLVCMLIDIDHFKQVNDTYGHDAGDRVLRETAQVMSGALRASDIVCRFGGEEFIAICPATGLEIAGKLGDRLRAAIAANTIAVPGFTGSVTVSVGVAGYVPDEVSSITELLKYADEALYAAKEAGRNKVCVMNMQTA
jgi:two-component system, cell cycle response regulator